MAGSGRFLAGIVAGFFIGYAIWGSEPAYIDNLKADSVYALDKPVVLTSLGKVQVAIIHGYADNWGVCEIIRQRITEEVMVDGCASYRDASGGTPWWMFWRKKENIPR